MSRFRRPWRQRSGAGYAVGGRFAGGVMSRLGAALGPGAHAPGLGWGLRCARQRRSGCGILNPY